MGGGSGLFGRSRSKENARTPLARGGSHRPSPAAAQFAASASGRTRRRRRSRSPPRAAAAWFGASSAYDDDDDDGGDDDDDDEDEDEDEETVSAGDEETTEYTEGYGDESYSAERELSGGGSWWGKSVRKFRRAGGKSKDDNAAAAAEGEGSLASSTLRGGEEDPRKDLEEEEYDPAATVRSAWGKASLMSLAFLIASIAEAAGVRDYRTSPTLFLSAIFTGLSTAALAVAGTFVLRRFATPFSVGFLLGATVVVAQQNLVAASLLYFGGTKSASRGWYTALFAVLTPLLSVSYLAFAALLYGRREAVVTTVDDEAVGDIGGLGAARRAGLDAARTASRCASPETAVDLGADESVDQTSYASWTEGEEEYYDDDATLETLETLETRGDEPPLREVAKRAQMKRGLLMKAGGTSGKAVRL